MTKLKLTKIIYAYDMYSDNIRAVRVYTPVDDGDYDITTSDAGVNWVKQEEMYTGRQWNDLLYKLKNEQLDVKVVKAIDEISNG